ncbi:hypothetical protein RJ639_046674 [Escallonia herrerae]|uniref:FYVE-type domain-containing protein n=1 Tax=Escallonia herrerae TaxID=1293975 RepID=A0AA88WID2_9ASTE|nr:hypothetical protein RJ639_046674 [Escallonia herrerae]
MQQGDMSSSYYQYYQSHSQNPNPNPTDPQFNSLPPTYASAPPISSSYSNYPSSTYPPYPQTTDHVPLDPSLSGPPHRQLAPYYPHDQNQPALNYDHLNSSHYDPNSSSSGSYGAPIPPNYENLGRYGVPEHGSQYDEGGFGGDEFGGGVYRYNGGKVEPYDARGNRSEASGGLVFDDYGRPISFTKDNKEQSGSGAFSKIERAAPKFETNQDSASGVQKFRVKLLSEGGGNVDMDVLCQIGLDGIRILDPATSRTLKIYSLETMTRWEVLDSYIFAFWAKSSIDIEPRRIRLKSNSYTTNNMLDLVAAATIQVKEMGGNKASDRLKVTEQPSEKKKAFGDWVNLMKPGNEEKDHWVPDEDATKCMACRTDFGAFVRKHHCRNCGDIFCDRCTLGRIALSSDEDAEPVRVCDRCMAEVTQRLSNATEAAARVTGLQSHEDLAKKLQEEMEKNRKISTGPKAHGSDARLREVECPTCTVHLQVQIPVSGSETIECSVCQHPFLVSAH